MSTTRSLAAAAASALLAAALVIGVALPTQAAPINPIPTPIQPGPSTPLPPGFTLPLFSIPSCATMVPDRAITATRVRYPSFGLIANTPGVYGAANSTLVSVITAHAGARTCTWGSGTTSQVVVTETAITAAEYKILKAWYDRNRSYANAGGGPVWPGAPTDTHYFVGTTAWTNEVALLSPNGWWVTVRDTGHIGALPYFEMDAVEQFLALNPRLALISH